MSISVSGLLMKFEIKNKAKPVNAHWTFDKMKVYSIASTGFTVSVGCFLLFVVYVHLTSQNVQFHTVQRDQSKQQPNDKIPADFMKNMNESIKRMNYDKEYASKNLSLGGPEAMNNAETEDDENLDPLFLDVMKVTRLRQAERGGLPDAKEHHDLSGYRSILNPDQSPELHCQKCAVVSSSSHMLHSGAGPAIDADRQCIFRMNVAPTLHFEEDVGVRTTVRVLSHASVSSLFKSQKDILGHPNATRYLIAWGPNQYMKQGGASHRRLKGLAGNYRKVDFYVASQKEMEYADLLFEKETGRPRSKSGSWLTTGWFTMILARSVCNEIHVYGMVGENYCKREHGRKHPYHYYNPHSQDECTYYRSMERSYKGGHRFMTEKAIFASWAKLSPKIYFHQPEWN